jgi:hypothetical protein
MFDTVSNVFDTYQTHLIQVYVKKPLSCMTPSTTYLHLATIIIIRGALTERHFFERAQQDHHFF